MASSERVVDGPAYRIVEKDLRDAIASGRYSPGSRLPTEVELADRYGVSRPTVRQAFRVLVSEGLVRRIRSKGTFVNRPLVEPSPGDTFLRSVGNLDELQAFWHGSLVEVVREFAPRPDAEAAGRLGIDPAEVVAGEIVRVHDDVPFVSSTLFARPEVADAILAHEPLRTTGVRTDLLLTQILDESSWGPIDVIHQEVGAVLVPADHAARIRCSAGEPVVRLEQRHFNAAGVAGLIVLSHCNPRRYTYRSELRRAAP